MALKMYIITQTANWRNGGEKSGTHRVTMDSSEIENYIAQLEGKVQVFEENLALSVDNGVECSSDALADSIRISHGVLKTQYIQNTNKRPIIFKTTIEAAITVLKNLKPFPAPHAADYPKDVSVDSGKAYLM